MSAAPSTTTSSGHKRKQFPTPNNPNNNNKNNNFQTPQKFAKTEKSTNSSSQPVKQVNASASTLRSKTKLQPSSRARRTAQRSAKLIFQSPFNLEIDKFTIDFNKSQSVINILKREFKELRDNTTARKEEIKKNRILKRIQTKKDAKNKQTTEYQPNEAKQQQEIQAKMAEKSDVIMSEIDAAIPNTTTITTTTNKKYSSPNLQA